MVALVQSPPASPRVWVNIPTREQLRTGTAPALSIAPLGSGPEDTSAKKNGKKFKVLRLCSLTTVN